MERLQRRILVLCAILGQLILKCEAVTKAAARTTSTTVTTKKAVRTTTPKPAPYNTCLGDGVLDESCKANEDDEWACCEDDLVCVSDDFTGWRYACVDPNSPDMVGFTGDYGVGRTAAVVSSATQKPTTTSKPVTKTTTSAAPYRTCLGNGGLDVSCKANVGDEWPCCQANLVCVSDTFTGWRYACVDISSPQLVGFTGDYGV